MISKSTFYRRYPKTVKTPKGQRAPTAYGLFVKAIQAEEDIGKALMKLCMGEYDKEALKLQKEMERAQQ